MKNNALVKNDQTVIKDTEFKIISSTKRKNLMRHSYPLCVVQTDRILLSIIRKGTENTSNTDILQPSFKVLPIWLLKVRWLPNSIVHSQQN